MLRFYHDKFIHDGIMMENFLVCTKIIGWVQHFMEPHCFRRWMSPKVPPWSTGPTSPGCGDLVVVQSIMASRWWWWWYLSIIVILWLLRSVHIHYHILLSLLLLMMMKMMKMKQSWIDLLSIPPPANCAGGFAALRGRNFRMPKLISHVMVYDHMRTPRYSGIHHICVVCAHPGWSKVANSLSIPTLKTDSFVLALANLWAMPCSMPMPLK